jgi:hypothetical protein
MAFGRSRTQRSRQILIAVGVIATLGFSTWLFGGAHLRQRDAALARARDAAVDGPPCAPLTAAEFQARGLKVRRATLYEGVVFSRQFGHMDCSALRYGGGWGTRTYPVCQFTGPNALHIRTPKGEWYFETGMGQPATVAAPDGQARCVLASNFTMKSLMGL